MWISSKQAQIDPTQTILCKLGVTDWQTTRPTHKQKLIHLDLLSQLKIFFFMNFHNWLQKKPWTAFPHIGFTGLPMPSIKIAPHVHISIIFSSRFYIFLIFHAFYQMLPLVCSIHWLNFEVKSLKKIWFIIKTFQKWNRKAGAELGQV